MSSNNIRGGVIQSSILNFFGGTVSKSSVSNSVTPSSQQEGNLYPGRSSTSSSGVHVDATSEVPTQSVSLDITSTANEGESSVESFSDCSEDFRRASVSVISENDRCRVSFKPVAACMENDEIPEKFHPSSTYKFPKQKFGTTVITERSFQSHWCDMYKWLHYDKVNDAAFCHLCMRAEKERKFLCSHRREPTFIINGFTNWKEANKGFSKHQSSACHKEAIGALCLLPTQIVGHVDKLMSDEIKQQKAMNRKIFMKILENTRYLARQDYHFVDMMTAMGIL